MFSGIVNKEAVFASSIWSAQFFSMSTEPSVNALFPITCIRDVASERKETVVPQLEPFSEYSYLGLENIESNIRALILPNNKKGADIKSTSKLFKSGDVLYGRLRPNLNKVYFVDNAMSVGICSTEIIVLTPNNRILAEYLAEVLLSDKVRARAESLTRGATLPRVQADDFLSIEIPLPDMETQKEIVDFIRNHREKWLHYRQAANNIPIHIQNSLHERLYNNKQLSQFVMG